MRYFLWNFSGRQDDMQGLIDLNSENGNWITGINFLDRARLGDVLDTTEISTPDPARPK